MLKYAARYIRMSTDHQKYSLRNQIEAIDLYAQSNGFEIVRTYADEGCSGLTIAGRHALKSLLRDISNGEIDFSVLLVYDVSRWGRFQDPDEAAAAELRCRHGGVEVHYCAEQFANDGTMLSMLMKAVKRVMAGEYSRELSVKVHASGVRAATLGYRLGSSPGYGLRRAVVDAHALPRILKKGEYKHLRTDHMTLVPGPPDEVARVGWIFREFVAGKSPAVIATKLNRMGVPGPRGVWTKGTIADMLGNEKYIGTLVWNRISTKLKTGRHRNEASDVVRYEKAFEGIVPEKLFAKALRIKAMRSMLQSDEELLDGLRLTLKRYGKLDGEIIGRSPLCRSKRLYEKRFGGILNAFERIGYAPPSGNGQSTILQRERHALLDALLTRAAARQVYFGRPRQYWVQLGERKIVLIISRARTEFADRNIWIVRFQGRVQPDAILIRRLYKDATPNDYVLVERDEEKRQAIRLTDDCGEGDPRRCATIDQVVDRLLATKVSTAI